MKTIPLTQGQIALVDDFNFDWLSRWKWYARKGRQTWYAVRNIFVPGKGQRPVSMHREILKLTDPKIHGEHRDGNGCNNQIENLRPASGIQNGRNRKKNRANTSGYKGVCWRKDHKKWHAQITILCRTRSLGYFTDPVLAAHAYDSAARKHFGEFARLNFPIS